MSYLTKSGDHYNISLIDIQKTSSETGDSLIFNKVRIYPKKLQFLSAYPHRTCKEMITIQNCGKEAVTVRILPPSLFAIQIRILKEGETLAPGLKITRIVKYVWQMISDEVFGVIPIMVNDSRLDYKVEIIPPNEKVVLDKEELNFGTVNVGQISIPQPFTLTNNGKY